MFLIADACLSPLVILVGIVGLIFAPIRPTWLDWITSIAPSILCPCLGLLAAVLLARRSKKALAIAYIAGACGIIPKLIAPIIVYWRHAIDPIAMPMDSVFYVRFVIVLMGTAWNSVYIFAARSFAKK